MFHTPAHKQPQTLADVIKPVLESEGLPPTAPTYDEVVRALRLCFKYVNGGSDLYPGLHREAYTAGRAVLNRLPK